MFFSHFLVSFVLPLYNINELTVHVWDYPYLPWICLSLTACGIWKKGYERISFSQEWDFVLGGGQTDAFISEGDTLCEGMDGYRKQFKLPEKDKGKVICLDFERATLNRKIWLERTLVMSSSWRECLVSFCPNTVSELWQERKYIICSNRQLRTI